MLFLLHHWWIFYKDSGAPPLWQKISQLAESEWKIIKNKQISNQISCFYSIFIIIFPIFCQIIQNLAFLAQIVQKYGSLIKKFPKNFSEKNESRCRGPWQKIDFFVKYSPVWKLQNCDINFSLLCFNMTTFRTISKPQCLMQALF